MIRRQEELYYEPAEILNRFAGTTTEMSKRELAFLCGLIKQYRPEKIVEIGVAAGGTTSVILQCIATLGYDAQLFSLDLSENYYRQPGKKTGYLIDECRELLAGKVNHTLLTGKYAVEYLESVGKGIDFLILDTVHTMPGELLDFLAFYQFLNPGSIVVLHDIALNHCSNNFEGFATKLLLDTVAAEKIMDFDDNTFPNIGAFIVSEDTNKYISNIFSALTITWKYRPGDDELLLYRDFYKKYYSCEDLKLFDMAVELNRRTLNRRAAVITAKRDEFLKLFQHIEQLKNKNVYIYGCGNYGKQFYHILNECGVVLKGFIISDGEELAEIKNCGRVYYLSEIELDKENDVIYLGVNAKLQKEICEELDKRGIGMYIIPDNDILEYMVN